MRRVYPKGTAVNGVLDWGFLLFLNVADCELLFCVFWLPLIAIHTVVMLLRVYAMWNRSKWILYLLLFVYVPQVIVSLVFAGFYNNATGMSQINVTCHYNLI